MAPSIRLTYRTLHHTSRHPRRGFTLIELMVVILIIIVIAALSLTGMRRMRDDADKVNSIKNLSQLQLANASYAADHNGRYVSLFATATDYRVSYNGRFSWTGGQARSNNGAMAYRYGGKALVTYFDGHAGEMSKADIKEFDSSRGGKNSSFWSPKAN
jgi:prepilin-type N-terminal cleavage/methylation domain-containing protein